MKKLLRILGIIVVLVIAFFVIKTQTVWLEFSPVTTEETGSMTTGIDLTNCLSYFDGCNTCFVQSGQVSGCTRMYCEKPSEPKCLQYATGLEVTEKDGQGDIFSTTDKYVVKTKENKTATWGGYEIYVYDKEGNKIFLLPQSDNDPQYAHEISGDYLVVDYGMGPDIRSMAIYDIVSQQKIFHSSYAPQYKAKLDGLYIEGNKVYFAVLVFNPNNSTQREITKPNKLPDCSQSGGLTVGYSEIRMFNLDTKQVEKTGKLVCTLLQ